MFHVPSTNATIISASARMLPHNFSTLQEHGTREEMEYVADELSKLINTYLRSGGATTRNLAIEPLKKNILNHATLPKTVCTKRVPPVLNPAPNTSTETSLPKLTRRKRWVHSRQKGKNTPGSIPIINTDRYEPLVMYTVPTPKTQKKREYTAPKANEKPSIITSRCSRRISPRYRTRLYANMALNKILQKEIERDIKGKYIRPQKFQGVAAAGVVHPITGQTITRYKELTKDPTL